MRGNLEPWTGEHRTGGKAAPMVAAAPSGVELIEDLRHLIAALDRRVPRLERSGEADIARDAAALREQAVARIAALERSR